GEEYLIYVNGYNPGNTMGRPWKVIQGSWEPKTGEIIIDRTVARKADLEIGDTLALGGKSLKLTGISDETTLMIIFMAFVTYEDAVALLPPNITNFYTIRLAPDSSPTLVKDDIESSIPGVMVTSSEVFAEKYKKEILGAFLPIIFVLTAIGLLVGILMIGLLVYTLTMERRKEYGVLKAIGATNHYLYKTVLVQALSIAVLGSFLGITILPPILGVIQDYVPEFVIRLSFDTQALVFLLTASSGFVASLIPVKILTKIDPVLVFKE
ncbi:MAG TPA: FtsX-like permease family protein, partial [Candidatus Hodarchaeales archaeon]|nr:FtsX-like permease family protein [Candidatus Hodarchaeales archaeon]